MEERENADVMGRHFAPSPFDASFILESQWIIGHGLGDRWSIVEQDFITFS